METGLALAGGGVSGTVALGVIRALEEAGITVTHIAGTSSGAIVAALYAYGLSTSEIAAEVPCLNKRYLDLDWKAVMSKMLFYRPHLGGWLKGKRLRDLIGRLTAESDLSAWKIPCAITATDLGRAQLLVFSNRKPHGFLAETDACIADAVRASFSIPVIFRPVRYKGATLVDGGILANCPVGVARALGAGKVIAVDPITPFVRTDNPPFASATVIFNQVINLTLKNQMIEQHANADLTLFPDVGAVGAFDFGKADQCVEAGYRQTMERMEEIKALLADSSPAFSPDWQRDHPIDVDHPIIPIHS